MFSYLFPSFLFLACSSSKDDTSSQDNANTWYEDCPLQAAEERLIQVGEINLNVACRGQGPTVVFLHGFPEFHYSWNKVMDELADDFRLIAPDQRGYNRSDKPEAIEDYELPLLTNDILNLLPIISEDPVILVAHDWGGPVGWMVAHTPNAHIKAFLSTNGPHPVRFADLIENDPAQQEASAYMDFFRQEGSEDLMPPEVLSQQFSDFLTQDELDIYVEAWSQPDAIKSGLHWYRANDITPDNMEVLMAEVSPTVPVPVSVMWGLDDDAVLASNAEELDVFAPDLNVLTFEDVDHWIEHRIPKEIAAEIRALNNR
ncbi:MAG: hypothetical protein CMK59_03655 [Proteobacteria bacterium]|nr:hypothetical protein [Pseudomonadota bacterium]